MVWDQKPRVVVPVYGPHPAMLGFPAAVRNAHSVAPLIPTE